MSRRLWMRRRTPVEPRELTEDLLSAYVDGELDAVMSAEVEVQIAGSPEWREALAEIGAARDALRGLEVHDAPADFWEQIVRDGPREPGAVDRMRRVVPRWAYAAAATAAVFVLAVAVVPRQHEVRPNVATLANAHAVRASVGGDPVAALAGAAVPVGMQR